MRLTSAILAVLAVTSVPAWADDSTASLDGGGLVLQKTDKVALVYEELHLSTKQVDVTYRFRNLTGADVEAIVAFPMPDITGGGENTVNIPNPDDVNFMKFKAKVNGQPVSSEVEQRAYTLDAGKAGEEITARLKSLHLPLMPTVEMTQAAIARLDGAQTAGLTKDGLLDQEDWNDDKGKRTVQVPIWVMRSKFWRPQVFRAGEETVVHETYAPAPGSSVPVFGAPDMEKEQLDSYRSRFCTDDAFIKAGQAWYKRATTLTDGSVSGYEQYLSYVITSGGNWAGPIGEFKLIVDKGSSATLVSFCGDNVKKTGPTTFEMDAKNYVPTKDISILLLQPSKP
jgi:hypothetical protein